MILKNKKKIIAPSWMAGCPKDISWRSILSVKSPIIPNFWTPFPFYSRHYNPFPLTGTGMENSIPEFWEREREWKIAFPNFGNGNGNEKLIPKIWEREWEAGIPGNGREREFPLTPGSARSKSAYFYPSAEDSPPQSEILFLLALSRTKDVTFFLSLGHRT